MKYRWRCLYQLCLNCFCNALFSVVVCNFIMINLRIMLIITFISHLNLMLWFYRPTSFSRMYLVCVLGEFWEVNFMYLLEGACHCQPKNWRAESCRIIPWTHNESGRHPCAILLMHIIYIYRYTVRSIIKCNETPLPFACIPFLFNLRSVPRQSICLSLVFII